MHHAPEVRTATTMRWAAEYTDDGELAVAIVYEQTEYADGSLGEQRIESVRTKAELDAWLDWTTP